MAVIVADYLVGNRFQRLAGVFDGQTQTCRFYGRNIVFAISNRNYCVLFDSEIFAES